MPSEEDLKRIHERLDDLFAQSGDVKAAIKRIEEQLGPCKADVEKLKGTVYGNGQTGLIARMTAAESGKVDTLSVKSVVTLVGAIGSLAAAIGGAMALLVK
jgi:hypothetical protein